MPPRRIGMFGGAFDPPHVAHVALARAAVEQLKLDELRIFPTGKAWHKSTDLTPANHRLALAQIAFERLPHTVVDDRELLRPGPTYTIDTLRELAAEHPEAELFIVMGQDQAVQFQRWKDWEAIAKMAVICVAARAHAQPSDSSDTAGLPRNVRVCTIELPNMPESATEVRAMVAHGEGIAHMVPPGVARYIDTHNLYTPA
ncbi:MAG: nicotinate-nucleotide adenylyltransferase [Pseudomonadota bacterium]